MCRPYLCLSVSRWVTLDPRTLKAFSGITNTGAKEESGKIWQLAESASSALVGRFSLPGFRPPTRPGRVSATSLPVKAWRMGLPAAIQSKTEDPPQQPCSKPPRHDPHQGQRAVPVQSLPTPPEAQTARRQKQPPRCPVPIWKRKAETCQQHCSNKLNKVERPLEQN